VDRLDRQRVEIESGHAAKVDRADLDAIRSRSLRKGLDAAGGAEAMGDLAGVEAIGGERALARDEPEIARGRKAQQQALVAAMGAVARNRRRGPITGHFEGNGAAMAASGIGHDALLQSYREALCMAVTSARTISRCRYAPASPRSGGRGCTG